MLQLALVSRPADPASKREAVGCTARQFGGLHASVGGSAARQFGGAQRSPEGATHFGPTHLSAPAGWLFTSSARHGCMGHAQETDADNANTTKPSFIHSIVHAPHLL